MSVYASIIIPTKNAGSRFNLVLKGIFRNKIDFTYEVIVVDSGSVDNTKEIIKNYPIRLIEIGSLSFSHGGVRNIGAENSQGDILIYLTQDAIPKGEDWLFNLTRWFKDKDVAGVFGRQIPDEDTSEIEKFFLSYTYPNYRIVKNSLDPDNCTLQDMFFSNVNSAIRRSLWEINKFREDLIMSEDQAWAKEILLKGKKIIYDPEAVVYHSHNYTLRRLISRNFDSGFSLRGLIKAPFKRKILYEIRYIKAALFHFLKNRLYRDFFIFPFYEFLRILSFSLGQYGQFLPYSIKLMLSENKIYWYKLSYKDL